MIPKVQVKTPSAKDALLDAATRLFTERGYSAVSTRELAEAAGVNLGAIQYYFHSKAELFAQTILQLMGPNANDARLTIEGDIQSEEEAAERLCLFISIILDRMLRVEEPNPCRMMYREIFSETAQDPELYNTLVSTVVEEFIRPLDSQLLVVLKQLKSESSEDELMLYIDSIIGQCAYYFTHQPFIEHKRNKNPAQSPFFDSVVKHIAQFSLRALGCKDTLIDRVMKKVLQNKQN